MRTFLLATALLLVPCVAPAWACINDSRTHDDEEEFRRAYEEREGDEAREEQERDGTLAGVIAALGGTVTLGGAVAYALKSGVVAAAV